MLTMFEVFGNRLCFFVLIGGKKYHTDARGFLLSHVQCDEAWEKAAMDFMGVKERTHGHDKIIGALRGYHAMNGSMPSARDLRDMTGISLREMYDLFPHGPRRSSHLIAGFPPPQG